MANEIKAQVRTALKAPDRTRDIEALAADLFRELFLASAGVKSPAGAARDALTAAREFYRVLDADQQPVKE